MSAFQAMARVLGPVVFASLYEEVEEPVFVVASCGMGMSCAARRMCIIQPPGSLWLPSEPRLGLSDAAASGRLRTKVDEGDHCVPKVSTGRKPPVFTASSR